MDSSARKGFLPLIVSSRSSKSLVNMMVHQTGWFQCIFQNYFKVLGEFGTYPSHPQTNSSFWTDNCTPHVSWGFFDIFRYLRLQHFLCGNFLGHFDDHHESPPVPWRINQKTVQSGNGQNLLNEISVHFICKAFVKKRLKIHWKVRQKIDYGGRIGWRKDTPIIPTTHNFQEFELGLKCQRLLGHILATGYRGFLDFLSIRCFCAIDQLLEFTRQTTAVSASCSLFLETTVCPKIVWFPFRLRSPRCHIKSHTIYDVQVNCYLFVCVYIYIYISYISIKSFVVF